MVEPQKEATLQPNPTPSAKLALNNDPTTGSMDDPACAKAATPDPTEPQAHQGQALGAGQTAKEDDQQQQVRACCRYPQPERVASLSSALPTSGACQMASSPSPHTQSSGVHANVLNHAGAGPRPV